MGQNISFGSSWSEYEGRAFEKAVGKALAAYPNESYVRFSKALAAYPNESYDRFWEIITADMPGRSVEELKERYDLYVRAVHSKLASRHHNVFSGPSHGANGQDTSEFNQNGKTKPKQKRRKGVAWSEDEHRRFLVGLAIYGKGDWRSISRHCVVSRTSTQVASHAQKYFVRQNSNTDENVRKRPSIHDVTVDETQNDPKRQRSLTMPNNDITVASQANQTTLEHTGPNMWNTNINKTIAQQPSSSLELFGYGRSNMWNNTQVSQAINQTSLNYPTYGGASSSSTIWNTEAALQPSASVPMYGNGSMMSHFGTNVNNVATPQMTYGGQQYRVPYYSGPNGVINLD